jgi:hypothetical protein
MQNASALFITHPFQSSYKFYLFPPLQGGDKHSHNSSLIIPST